MENFAKDFITLLQYLLPGFLAAWVFYGFTSFPKPSQFERVIQALIFTLIIQAIVVIEKKAALWLGEYKSFGNWTNQVELIFLAITAIILGVLFAYFVNHDKLHKFARDKKITLESSYPSEWFGAFLKNVTFVVLHLSGERRLYGWPIEWPSEPDKGHFVIEQPSWLIATEEIPITGVSSIMVDVEDVEMVEFMQKTWEE